MEPGPSIVEVGPRDGLQSEPGLVPTATKLAYIERAIDAGLRRIEVTSFAHPRRVPQMADAEAVIAGLPRRDDVDYLALVLNRRGFERALACGVDEISMVVVATDTYCQRNQGMSTERSIETWLEIARDAKGAGLRAGVTLAAAFGCPYEGELSLDRVIRLVDRLMEGEPVELGLADSIGVAVPVEISRVLAAVRRRIGDTPVRCHLHNTRNTGLANAQAAVDAGVAELDASIGGIGGCPFAPAATGNIPTCDLVYMLQRSGLDTGIDLHKLISASRWLEGELGRSLPAMLPRAGIFPEVATRRRAS